MFLCFQVPPMTFCEVWVRDSEYVSNQCVALAAYVASCHKFNICIEWRSPDYCRKNPVAKNPKIYSYFCEIDCLEFKLAHCVAKFRDIINLNVFLLTGNI